MAWTLHVQGDSLNARRAVEGAQAAAFGATPAVVNTDEPGINGSTSIDLNTAAVNPVLYKGGNNVPQTGVFTIVMRVKFKNIASNQPLFTVGFGGRIQIFGLSAYFHGGNSIRFYAVDESGSQFSVFSSTSIATLDTWHDFIFHYEETTNGMKIYSDGSLVGQGTPTITMPNLTDYISGLSPQIAYYNDSVDEPQYYLDEFALDDTIVSASTFTGASRSSYISTVSMDGPNAVVLPTESQVLNTVSFTDGVTSYTGNVTQPIVANVATGIQYGVNGTEYTGTLVVNQPVTDVTSISSLVSSIKSKTSFLLGNDWSEINYVNETEKNTSKGVTKRYGVRSLPAVEVPGVTRAVTADQTFEVVLTDRYVNSNMSDSAEQTVSHALQDKALSLYKYYIETRLNNLNVLNLTEYACEEPEINEKSKYVTVRFTFKVRLRNILGS